MVRRSLSITFAMVFALATLAYAGSVPAAADDDDDEVITLRLELLVRCLQGVTEIEFPAETSFFVSQGFGFPGWSTRPSAEQAAILSSNTRFDLRVDGERHERPDRSVEYSPATDALVKLFRTDFDDGMEDTHVFTGIWRQDGLLVGGTPGRSVVSLRCDLTVHFVGGEDDGEDEVNDGEDDD